MNPRNIVLYEGEFSRLKSILSKSFSIDARNIHAYIIGEHGDSEIAAWNATKIAGMSVDEYASEVFKKVDFNFKERILDEVRNAAYEIINRKGYTNYAVALAVRRIVEAVLRDEQSILTVSSLFSDSDTIFKYFGRFLQVFAFFIVHGYRQNMLDSIASDHAGHRHIDVRDPFFTAE